MVLRLNDKIDMDDEDIEALYSEIHPLFVENYILSQYKINDQGFYTIKDILLILEGADELKEIDKNNITYSNKIILDHMRGQLDSYIHYSNNFNSIIIEDLDTLSRFYSMTTKRKDFIRPDNIRNIFNTIKENQGLWYSEYRFYPEELDKMKQLISSLKTAIAPYDNCYGQMLKSMRSPNKTNSPEL